MLSRKAPLSPPPEPPSPACSCARRTDQRSAAQPYHRPAAKGVQFYGQTDQPPLEVVGQPHMHMAAELQVGLAGVCVCVCVGGGKGGRRGLRSRGVAALWSLWNVKCAPRGGGCVVPVAWRAPYQHTVHSDRRSPHQVGR